MTGRLIPRDTLVQHDGEALRECFLVDETLTITMANGQGFSLALRLSPSEAIGFAEHLAYYANLAMESEGLSAAEPIGSA
jgi:hypothetical protein